MSSHMLLIGQAIGGKLTIGKRSWHLLAHGDDFATFGLVSPMAMEVWIDESALQFNDGGGLDIPVPGHDGVTYGARSSVCLEAQRSPDNPSHAHFSA